MVIVKDTGKELMEHRHLEEMRELAMEEPRNYLVLLERVRRMEAKMEQGFSAVLEKAGTKIKGSLVDAPAQEEDGEIMKPANSLSEDAADALHSVSACTGKPPESVQVEDNMEPPAAPPKSDNLKKVVRFEDGGAPGMFSSYENDD